MIGRGGDFSISLCWLLILPDTCSMSATFGLDLAIGSWAEINAVVGLCV